MRKVLLAGMKDVTGAATIAGSNGGGTGATSNGGPVKEDIELEHYKVAVTVLNDQCSTLKERLASTDNTIERLRQDTANLENSLRQLQSEYEECRANNHYLENEWAVYRDLYNDLRNGVSSMGGSTGQHILTQINDKAADKMDKMNHLHSKQSNASISQNNSKAKSSSSVAHTTKTRTTISSNSAPAITTTTSSATTNSTANAKSTRDSPLLTQNEDEGSDQSDEGDGYENDDMFTNQFLELGEEISRTGTLGLSKPKAIVYERLTNPLNFTGSMKILFEKEALLSKREKVQRIKNQSQTHPFSKSTGTTIIYMFFSDCVYLWSSSLFVIIIKSSHLCIHCVKLYCVYLLLLSGLFFLSCTTRVS